VSRKTKLGERDITAEARRLATLLGAATQSSSSVSELLVLPGLVAAWPMSAVRRDSATDMARDVSGNGYHLTGGGTGSGAQFAYDGLIPYAKITNAPRYLFRADGGAANWADITGLDGNVYASYRGLAIGGWVYFDYDAANEEFIIGKWSSAGGRSYELVRQATGELAFSVSSNGTAVTTVTSAATMSASEWYCVAGVCDPSMELACYLDRIAASNTTSIPASLYDSATNFTIGRSAVGSEMNGRVSHCFLSQMALSGNVLGAFFDGTRKLFGV
jgi:hypothetical protein